MWPTLIVSIYAICTGWFNLINLALYFFDRLDCLCYGRLLTLEEELAPANGDAAGPVEALSSSSDEEDVVAAAGGAAEDA